VPGSRPSASPGFQPALSIIFIPKGLCPGPPSSPTLATSAIQTPRRTSNAACKATKGKSSLCGPSNIMD